ncbi:metallophosphoesterase [Bacillus sp. FJAT-45350]|uniref:metallophosphoesterase n=1 Tax=Bacillus sp. FJAT-45350 TaxID=2011014 RepID=UPI000BB89FA5|nr:metallophosphoesterase [Bacillus sp. FJAT-45350]
MKKRLILSTIFVCIIILSAKIYFDTNEFKVNTVQFQTKIIPSNSEFTVLQISDLHNKVFGVNNEKLINTVENLDADIIVITGDLIDRSTDDFKHVFSLIENITTINQKVFFVSGNHEWGNSYTSDFIKGLRERNITILNNENTQITIRDVTINLAGLDDASTNHENVEEAFNGINQELYTFI